MNFFERIKNNWQLKILALIMGLILWFYVVKISKEKIDHFHTPVLSAVQNQLNSETAAVK